MSYEKIRIYSVFLLLGIAALFLPATALQNSIAMGQEFYPEYKENEYYNQEYYPYQNDEKNAPIVNVEKKFFVCNDVNNLPDNLTDTPVSFKCPNPANFVFPAGPDSDDYIPCNDELCPPNYVDESDFGVQIFKDVATVLDLSPEGTPVNLDKFHYTVTEEDIDQRITTDDKCSAVGFDHSNFFLNLLEDGHVLTGNICVNYVGDCEGTIYSDEVKTCTVENYFYAGAIYPPPEPEDNAEGNTLSLQQSNNQAIQPQTFSLRDTIADRTN